MSGYLETLYVAVVGTLTAGITWLVRTVLTNQKKIELMELEIKNRDTRRDEDRQILLALKKDIEEVRSEILEIYKTK